MDSSVDTENLDDIQSLQEKLPWHSIAWEFFIKRFHNKSLPHGLMLAGAEGLGKQRFARQAAAMLLCQQPSKSGACFSCKACQLYLTGSHPDFHYLGLEEGQQIKVADVRMVCEKLANTAQQNGYKVVIIEPADKMNMSAANALLKTLEEPTNNTVLLLVTHQPESLLATIRSRCQALTFATPNTESVATWLAQRQIENSSQLLALAQGAPLLALQYAKNESYLTDYHHFMKLLCSERDPIRLTEGCLELLKNDWLLWLQQFFCDIVRCQHHTASEHLFHQSYIEDIREISAHLSTQQSYTALESVQELAKLLRKQPNLNLQLQLEALFIGLYDIYGRQKTAASG